MIYGPKLLTLLQVVGMVGPKDLAPNTPILCDFCFIRSSQVAGIHAPGPLTTTANGIHGRRVRQFPSQSGGLSLGPHNTGDQFKKKGSSGFSVGCIAS